MHTQMDRYAVAGNPVEHSQSPAIHAAFARQTGQALEYGRLFCPLDGFADALRAFAASGAQGCNVTVPFKFEAFTLAAWHTERAALAQAANTLRFDGTAWLADNTDGAGLVRDIEHNAGVRLEGKRLLLVGAGGAAAGALGPLLAAKPAALVVANRSRHKADVLVERHRAVAATCDLRATALEDCGVAFDVIVNASASSLAGGVVPVAAAVLRPGALAVDMMYGAPADGFLAWAEANGAVGRDGLGMLVEQAALAFELWRGLRPETAAVLAAMRQSQRQRKRVNEAAP